MKPKVGKFLSQLLALTLCTSIALPALAKPQGLDDQSLPLFKRAPKGISLSVASGETANGHRELIVATAKTPAEEQQIEEFLRLSLATAQKSNPELKPRLDFVDVDGPEDDTAETAQPLKPEAEGAAQAIAPDEHVKISFSRKVSNAWTRTVDEFKKTWREDPSLIVYTLARGTANGVFTAWSMHRYQHVDPAVADIEGLIFFLQSGLFMYKVNFYLKWLFSNPNEFVRFSKADSLELGYLFLPQLLLIVTKQQPFEGVKSLLNYFASATMGTAQQMPMEGAISETQKKLEAWTNRGDPATRKLMLKHGVRSALLFVSLLEVAVAAGQLTHSASAQKIFWILFTSGWGAYLYQRGFHKKIYAVAVKLADTMAENSEKFLKENSCRGTLGFL